MILMVGNWRRFALLLALLLIVAPLGYLLQADACGDVRPGDGKPAAGAVGAVSQPLSPLRSFAREEVSDGYKGSRFLEVACRCSQTGLPVDASVSLGSFGYSCIGGRCLIAAPVTDVVIDAYAPGFRPTSRTVHADEGSVELAIEPLHWCRVTVVDAQGGPVADAVIELVGPGASRELARTDVAGLCGIGCGQSIVVRAMGRGMVSKGDLIGPAVDAIRLCLNAIGQMAVLRVVDADGGPCLPCDLTVVRTDLPVTTSKTVAIGEDGQCSAGLDPGEYWIPACQYPYEFRVPGMEEARNGDRARIRLSASEEAVLIGTRMRPLLLRVVDGVSGEPLHDVEVWLEGFENDERIGRVGWGGLGQAERISAVGQLVDAGRLLRARVTGEAEASMRVGVTAEGYGVAYCNLAAFLGAPVHVTLQAAEIRNVRVRLPVGECVTIVPVDCMLESGPVAARIACLPSVATDGHVLRVAWRGGDLQLHAVAADGPLLATLEAWRLRQGPDIESDLRELGVIIVRGVPPGSEALFVSENGGLLLGGVRSGESVCFSSLGSGAYHIGTRASQERFRRKTMFAAKGEWSVSRGVVCSVSWGELDE